MLGVFKWLVSLPTEAESSKQGPVHATPGHLYLGTVTCAKDMRNTDHAQQVSDSL